MNNLFLVSNKIRRYYAHVHGSEDEFVTTKEERKGSFDLLLKNIYRIRL